jgi:tRNA(fMet)-specific endonuclease VapC
MYCLDTNIISYALMGKKQVANKILQTLIYNISTTIITETELLFGAYNSSKIEYNLSQIRGFLNQIEIFNLDSPVVEIFAKEKTRLIKYGKTVENMDLLIASICLRNDLILVTNNQKHFAHFEDLKLENWTIDPT